ncbi:N-acetylmuramic acid 6-phosphate etherase [Roseibium sp.]|uniref:N-acetylmuramic acid 6-phosphate etherase n=1 Tax=Roseibium sp. TaxID=1936156 RepID=UPI003B525F14
MPKATTEKLHHLAAGIDSQPAADVASILIQGQISAAQSVENAKAAITTAAMAMARTIRAGGSLYYIAAGSSGLMAAADAMELGGTFGIPADQIRIMMAGGIPTSAYMPGDTEDATADLEANLANLSEEDTVLVVSASGSTPYTLEAARLAVAAKSTLIAIANNADALLFEMSTHAIYLPTAPEIVSGSTRMGAGTAQKIALNTLSTLMALELGHIYDGMMVNLRADNIKLRERARRIVTTITGATLDAASAAIEKSNGNVKYACLLAAGAQSITEASDLLGDSGGHLRPALEKIRAKTRWETTHHRTEGTRS